MEAEWKVRKDIVRICRLMHEKGLISATDGNVSVRLSPDRIITTPRGLGKGFLSERELVVIDYEGNVISGDLLPSSEIMMHLAAYRLRPEINAVVHGHPPVAIAFTIAGLSLAKCVLPEVVLTLGTIPTARYATPSTEEVPESIKDFLPDHDAILLERHGAVTLGRDLLDAYYKLEKIEHTAYITYIARNLGQVSTLSESQIEKLLAAGGADEMKRSILCVQCGACGREEGASEPGSSSKDMVSIYPEVPARNEGGRSSSPPHPPSSEELIGLIREEILKELNKG
jgi:L-fuculose-phosphate aldolase